MRRLLSSRFALLALVACSDTTTNPVTQLNLDRPVDVAFACYGGLRITNGNPGTAEDRLTSSAQPVESCAFRSGQRMTGQPAPQPPGQEDIGTSKTGGTNWYAFVLQSGPGTVAIARFETKPSSAFSGSDVQVLDADELTPGKNGISVGEDPIAIVTDKVGCFEVIANQGSCDLSTLDVNSVFQPPEGFDSPQPKVARMDVKNALGEPIQARPAAMVFEPPGGVIGTECPAQPTGLAYIAYPSCHLVAGVDVSTGTIVTGIQYDAAGVPTVLVGGNVTCPAECDGAPPTPGIRPVALDLEKDQRTGRTVLAIGADNSNILDVYDLDLQSSFPLSLSPIELQNTTGRLGITSVAISPVVGMGGENGSTTGIIDDSSSGGDHQFVYAVTNDGSVRVADLTGAPRECDTQIDPRYLHEVRDVDRLSCFPVKVPDQTCTTDTQCGTNFCNASTGKCSQYPRRAGARGPGIELIGDAIPTSVDIAKVDKIEGDTRSPGTPLKLIGYFGMITSASGRAYIFTVDNDDFADYVAATGAAGALATPIPLDIAHQLKDAFPNRGLLAEEDGKFVCDATGPDPDAQGGNSGGPRLGAPIQRSIPSGVIAPENVGGLPSLRQVFCDVDGTDKDRPVSDLFFSAPVDVREEVFPDLRALRADETWTLTYEGSLSNDKADTAVDGPTVRTSQLFIDGAGMHLVDNSRPFCDAGVEQFDVVQMRGCDPSIGDAGCPIGYTCYVHPQSQVTGIGSCMLVDEAERLSNACKPFLTTLRRYTVSRAKTGELVLLPRKSVLRTTPLSGCDTDAQCELLADYAAQTASSLNPSDPDQPTDSKTWRCLPDPDRKPVTTGKRCLNVCTTDTDCGFGAVCQANPGAPSPQTGFCMEGVTPPQACVNAPQRYELRAGEAFAVVGNLHGYVHPIVADASGSCVRDPNANPLQIGRIPLDALPCDPTADSRTGRRADGTYDPNPCKATVQETEYQFNFVPGTCTLGTPDESIVTRDATALRFRNNAMVMTMVDPTYQGDALCNGDRQGTLSDVPLVMSGYQLAFRQTAGFAALQVAGIAPALPIKVLRGPTESFWIVDEGDFLSTSISQASTRGKVYRVESRAINVINLLE